MWGEFNGVMSKVGQEKDPGKRKSMATQSALPLRKQLVAQAELAMQWKMNTTSTTGGLGATANFQQMVLSNSLALQDCTDQGVSQGCFNHTRNLKLYLGVTELPVEAMPARGYTGVERCFVLSPRGSIEKGRPLTIRLIALLDSQGKAKATLHVRPMGNGTAYTV